MPGCEVRARAHLRTIRLGSIGIETSALGFGCADLFRDSTRTTRPRLLEAAFDAGIRHFDVAPMYGLGLAEAEVGRFARGKRDMIVIATKFGIEPTFAGRLVGQMQGAIQRVVRPKAGDRSPPAVTDPRSGIAGSFLYRPNDYSARAARASLERSLRELRTDHIDLLFLHDPTSAAEVPDGIRGYLDSARSAGRIRAWGIAGERTPAVAVAQRLGGHVPVLQVRGDVFSRTVAGMPSGYADAVIMYGVIGRALARILAHTSSNPHVRRRWSDAIAVDCGRPEEIANLLLRDALRANPDGTVLFSTTRADRIEAAAAAARSAPEHDPASDALRSLVRAELAVPPGEP